MDRAGFSHGSLHREGNGIRLSLKPLTVFEVQPGESVSVNGVCLTVVKCNGDMSFDVSPETMRSTNLGDLKVNDSVNLERALRLSDRMGGHIVTGHVDGTGKVVNRRPAGEYTFYTFETSPEILKYIVKKGSVAVDGISLTVVDLDTGSFSVAIIPHTLTATTIGDRGTGDKVNLEVDIIGKYVEKFLGKKGSDSDLMKLLEEEGFAND